MPAHHAVQGAPASDDDGPCVLWSADGTECEPSQCGARRDDGSELDIGAAGLLRNVQSSAPLGPIWANSPTKLVARVASRADGKRLASELSSLGWHIHR